MTKALKWILLFIAAVVWGMGMRADVQAAAGTPEEDFTWEGTVIAKYNGSDADVVIPAKATEIKYNAFSENETLISVDFSLSSVQTIGYGAFARCSNLENVIFGNRVTELGGYAFAFCFGLKELYIPDSVVKIGDFAFKLCWHMNSITIANSAAEIGGGAFNGCPGLADAEGFVVYRNVLYDYWGTEEIVRIPEGITEISMEAFDSDSTIRGVVFSDSVRTISTDAFYTCANLAEVTFGSGLKEIGFMSFAYCDSLTELVLPNSLEKIGYETFCSCKNLKKVTIGNRVKEIGFGAFSSNPALEEVYFYSSDTVFNTIVFQPSDRLVIHGISGSSLQTFAESNGINFVGDLIWYNGWVKENGLWYYYVENERQSGWVKVSGKWYYLNDSGVMQTGWQKVDGKWYYLSASGAMVKGWSKISGKWYYFNASGAMLTGWQTIDGSTYFFKSSGAMAAKEWCGGWWLSANGTWTYPYKATWRKNAKGWWFGDESGWYAKNCTITIDGKSYTFDANGYMK